MTSKKCPMCLGKMVKWAKESNLFYCPQCRVERYLINGEFVTAAEVAQRKQGKEIKCLNF